MVVRDLLFLFCPCGCPILSVLCEGWVLALPLASCLLPLLFTGAPSFAAFAKGGPGHQPLACPERSRREPSPLLSRDDGEGPAFSFVGALLVYPEERRAAPAPAPVRQGRALPESRPAPDLTLSFRASRSAVSGQRGIGCYRLFCKRPRLPRTYCLCKGMASAMPKRNDKTNPSFCASSPAQGIPPSHKTTHFLDCAPRPFDMIPSGIHEPTLVTATISTFSAATSMESRKSSA